MEREHAFNGGKDRPDFLITTHDSIFIIEAKIWDQSHHFDQYRKILENKELNSKDSKGHLAYIVNYAIDCELLEKEDQKAYRETCCNGNTVKTWNELVSILSEHKFLKDDLISAYASFIKNVCSIDKYVPDPAKEMINLSQFNTFKDLYAQITNAVNNKDFGLKLYSTTKSNLSKKYWGQYFEWSNYEKGKSVWGWYGFYFNDDKVFLCIDFEDADNWGKSVCEDYQKQPLEDGHLRFYFKGGREEINIENFLKNILNAVKNNSLPDKTVISKREEATNFSDIFVIKAFPCMIEQFFYGLEINNEYKIIESSGADQEDPEKYCGRYFKLKSISVNRNELHKPLIDGWIGVLYETDEAPAQFIVEIERGFVENNLNRKPSWEQDNEWWWKFCIPAEKTLSFKEILEKTKKVLEDLLSR